MCSREILYQNNWVEVNVNTFLHVEKNLPRSSHWSIKCSFFLWILSLWMINFVEKNENWTEQSWSSYWFLWFDGGKNLELEKKYALNTKERFKKIFACLWSILHNKSYFSPFSGLCILSAVSYSIVPKTFLLHCMECD